MTLGDATEQASRPVAPRADARSHEIDHGFALWVHDALTQRLHLRVRLKELATEVYEAGAAELSFADLAPGRPAERLVELAAPEGKRSRAGAASCAATSSVASSVPSEKPAIGTNSPRSRCCATQGGARLPAAHVSGAPETVHVGRPLPIALPRIAYQKSARDSTTFEPISIPASSNG